MNKKASVISLQAGDWPLPKDFDQINDKETILRKSEYQRKVLKFNPITGGVKNIR